MQAGGEGGEDKMQAGGGGGEDKMQAGGGGGEDKTQAGGGGGEDKAQANGGAGDQSQPRMQSQSRSQAITAAATPHGGHHQHHQHHPPPPPPWMATAAMMHHHPAATMVMQHHMMAGAPPAMAQFAPSPPPPPPHYVHYQQQYHQGGGGGGGGSDDNKSIWVGDLLYWMDENYLHSCFAHTGEVVSIKVIRNKQTGQSEGYGFVEFYSHATAEKVLINYNGMTMPNTDMAFRLNWASFSMGERRNDAGSDLSIFVGDLASDVTDTLLQDTFASRYTSVKGAKVVIDANTGRSKGYGFVRFGDESEKTRAMCEMNGVYCSSRAMRIGAATPRKSSGAFSSNGSHSDGDSCNTTVFVGGLDPSASEEDLRHAFSQYGEIASVKIPVGKQCGFVQFIHRNNAEEALQRLNGTVIGNQTVRLSWGRNPANKQRADTSHQWNNAYNGGQIYNGYGYATPPYDPRMYAAAYGFYPIYGNQQQVS